MEKYLIISDLDRTLLNKKSKISYRTRKFIKKIEKKGHYFIMATGRPYQGVKTFIKQLKPEIVVCDNGASIYFLDNPQDNIITPIKKELFLELIKEIEPYILAGLSGDYKSLCMYNENMLPDWMKHIDNTRTISRGNFLEILNHDPINPNLFIKRSAFNKVINILDTKYTDTLGYRYWDNPSFQEFISLEIYNKNINKGVALDILKEKLNIRKENDLAFGDSLNDIELLLHANNGVAINNARPEVKKISKYITKEPNFKNGEIKFIKGFLKKQNAW